MEILAIYDDITKQYVERVYDYLVSKGYSISMQHIQDYEGNYICISTPTLLIKKFEKYGYPIQGKQPLDVILNWAKNSGA
jgi:hypothetical protein